MRHYPTVILLLGLVLSTACGGADSPRDTPPVPAGQTTLSTVQVFFTRGEAPQPVPRTVPTGPGVLRSTLDALLRGPTAAEREKGFTSFFSPATAGMLRDVTVTPGGRALVDFRDFSRIIPNASTSAGSQALLGELNATVFQFPTVSAVEYRFEGSCEAFWHWLQRPCQTVRPPGR